MSLVGGKGNSLRRIKLSGRGSNNTTDNRQRLSQHFLHYLFFSGAIPVSMSGRKDLSWVALFVSSCIRGPSKKQNGKNRIFFGDSIVKLSRSYIRVLTRFEWSTIGRFHPQKTATRSPSSVWCHAGALSCYFPRQCWTGLDYQPTPLLPRFLKDAQSHALSTGTRTENVPKQTTKRTPSKTLESKSAMIERHFLSRLVRI